MKIVLLSFLLSFVFAVDAQQWLEPSAKWNYSHFNIFGGGFYGENTTANVSGDTIIDGHICQVIQWSGASLFSPANYYTYQANDSIFFLLDNSFVLAFRKNMNIGDTLFIKRPSIDTSICQATNLFYSYRLDSIALYPKSVTPLNTFYFSRSDTFKQWAGTNIYFIEKIGFNCLPYPFVPACVFDGSNFDLCNYGDSTITGFWMNPNIQACETVGIEIEKSKNDLWNIGPNPVADKITLNTFSLDKSKLFSFQLVDFYGKTLTRIYPLSASSSYIINTSDFSKGIYFAVFYENQTKLQIRKIEKL